MGIIVSASGESDICLWLMGFSRTYWTCGVFPTFVVILEWKRHRTKMVKRRQSWKKVWGRGAWTSSAEKETWFQIFFPSYYVVGFSRAWFIAGTYKKDWFWKLEFVILNTSLPFLMASILELTLCPFWTGCVHICGYIVFQSECGIVRIILAGMWKRIKIVILLLEFGQCVLLCRTVMIQIQG